MPAAQEDFRNAMRRLAAGVTVVTTAAPDGTRRGLTATAVCSVSLTPPMLLACINKTAAAHDPLRASGRLAVNLLGGTQEPLARRFGGAESGEARFEEGEWIALVTGAPVLATALAAFDCRVVQMLDAGSHTVFLAAVEATHLPETGGAPLLYLDGGYGGFAATSAPRSDQD